MRTVGPFQAHRLLAAAVSVPRTIRVQFRADRVDARVRSAAGGHVLQGFHQIGFFVIGRVRGTRSLTRPAQAVRETVDGDDAFGAQQARALDRELADGTAAHTAMVSPGLISHRSAPMYPVGKMSDRNSTCSSLKPFSIFSGPTSANGTRAYCAWPPANPPSMCE
jgi:hypothetical protein